MKKFFALALICALVLTLVPSVALADATSDLQTALNNGGTVTLSDDIVLTAPLTIPAGVSVTLDLNGKTLSYTDSSAGTVAMIQNSGTLTIQDSKSSGKLSFKTTTPDTAASPVYASNTIRNDGNLTVKGGTIENNSNGGACYAIDAYAGSTTSIEGGKITALRTTVRVFNWSSTKAKLSVSGGEIISDTGYAINANMGGDPAVEIDISDGTITSENNAYGLAIYVFTMSTAKDVKVNVSGGDINGALGLNGLTCTTINPDNLSISGGSMDSVICYDMPPAGFISGGRFGEQPDASYVENGALVIDTNDGSDAPFVIGDEAKKALAKAAPGSTIDIVSAPAGTTITVPAGVTVNIADGAKGNVVVEYISAPAAPAEVPETGDHDLPILCAVLALLSLVGMGLAKRVSNRI